MGDKTGTAKCSPTDTFDFMTGAKLALERLKEPEKPRLNWDAFKAGGISIKCETEAQSRAFLLECDKHNIIWNGGKKTSSYRLQHFLHRPVAFFILPLFAIANTGIAIDSNWHEGLTHANSIGIMVGLIVGKPIGITLFALLCVKLGIGSLPKDLHWKHILGAGMLGGIGFTMSIFITLLAFKNDGEAVITYSKIAILVASFVSGTLGFLWLKLNLKK
jgi:Na+/H+ antiporter NhaA